MGDVFANFVIFKKKCNKYEKIVETSKLYTKCTDLVLKLKILCLIIKNMQLAVFEYQVLGSLTLVKEAKKQNADFM